MGMYTYKIYIIYLLLNSYKYIYFFYACNYLSYTKMPTTYYKCAENIYCKGFAL